jgi:hypothetical protein
MSARFADLLMVAPSFSMIDPQTTFCIMAPSVAAGVHRKLATLPKFNEDLPNSDYPDLSKIPALR